VQRVLLCGWGETQFMGDLLMELDHGPSALPPGSSVTLLNSRPTSHIMSAPWLALTRVALHCIRV
jgi:hypothetical protein